MRNEDYNQIKQLLKEAQLITESYDRAAEATGENFNIFSILQMETDEVATHSRFIAELLNPRGRHGQNDVFLKKFIELFDITDFQTEKAFVKVEHHIGKLSEDKTEGGRIDIFIKSRTIK